MFYIRTADKLTRTAPWLDNMEGGIDYLRSVIIDDKLGLNDHLEEELARLRAAFACEWTETVNNGGADRFKHFITATSATRTFRWCRNVTSTARPRRMSVSRLPGGGKA
ncbi:hypothetical protein BANRA_00015 [Klebsiella pneumoniae]|nr:hypothetical protein BANRA_00015 [Klebsiella pneumoniae]